MSKLWIAALLLPAAAFADLSGTVTLPINTAVNLDTGATASSGLDLLWNGTSLAPQGSVVALDISAVSQFSTVTGSAGFGEVNLALLQAGLSLASSNPIKGIKVNDVLGALDNAGDYAKMLVTALSGTTITLQYLTYGAGTTKITMVQNNYSYLVPGVPNYGIAPGSIFIIKGANMASVPTASITALQSSASPGIPTTLNGASITVTVNGTTVHPGMYYAGDTQIAAVLPSNTPAGTGTITVTYNSTPSNSASILVVTTALGLDTYYGTGSGLATATDLSYNVFNYNKSASPGQNIILWGSGLGADPSDSDTTVTTSPHAVNVPLTVYIGGIAVTPGYAGSSGFPGLNQINVAIPAGVAPGCSVAVVAVSGTIVSNTVTLPIAAGGGVCSDPLLGITGTQLLTLAGKASYNRGSLILFGGTQAGKEADSAIASFQKEPGAYSGSGSGLASVGNCEVTSSAVGGSSSTTGLDAGTITVQGAAGTQTLLAALPGFYGAQLPSGFIPAAGGSFTFTGTGGADVGPFTANVSISNPITWTNMSAAATITRTSGFNVTWSGGAPNSIVVLNGNSASTTASGSFLCYAPVSAGQFTIPSYVLLALPAGTGQLIIENSAVPASFTATGLDSGAVLAGVSFGVNSTYN